MVRTNTDDPNFHVVMLPWSAFGHLIPFYHLSTSLAKKGVRVSYISTPKNIERLPKIPPYLAPLLQYVAFPFPAVPENALPLGAEATLDMEFDEVQYLKAAYDLLREPFKRFVLASSPDWIISDFAAYWAPDVARECRTKLMHFSVFMTTFLLFFQSLEFRSGEGRKRVNKTHESPTTQPAEILPPPSVTFRDNEAVFLHNHLNSKSTFGITEGERAGRLIEGCKAIAIRTCREFDGDYIDHYQTLTDKPVIPIGLLPPPHNYEEEKTTSGNWRLEFEWLDKQKHKSVIYVGFGSEYKLTKHEIYEIAYGLELARVPFIWALRRPTWATDDSESLPPEFLTRTSGKGLVWLGWVPQLEILGHPAIGGSLFHSGWGSIIEALKYGHSLVLLPFIFDQGLNARLMVDKGLGVEVERRDDGSYTRDDIANALRRAMVGDEAERIRAQASKAAEIFGDEKLHQEHYVGGLVEFLRNGNIE